MDPNKLAMFLYERKNKPLVHVNILKKMTVPFSSVCEIIFNIQCWTGTLVTTLMRVVRKSGKLINNQTCIFGQTTRDDMYI